MAAKRKKRELCVHVGSASYGPMHTQCFRSKAKADRLVREARREGFPVRVQYVYPRDAGRVGRH